MSEWKEYRLGDLCYKVCSGGTPKSTCSAYYEGGTIPWLNTKEINYNRIFETESHITENGLNNSSAKWIDANAVVVAMYGATAGRVAIAKVPMTTNQACCNLMIDSFKADYDYIYYYLSNSYKQLLSMANGAAQQNLNAQVIKDFLISLPSLPEQRRIASILSSLDSKIECNRKICANLEAQAQALFKHWFIDFAPFKEGKFVESELGMIPEGWRVGKAEDFYTINIGKTPPRAERQWFSESKEGNKIWISISDMGTCGAFISDSKEYLTPEAQSKFNVVMVPQGTVLLSFKLTIGRVAIADTELTTNEAIARFILPDNYYKEFTYLYLKQYKYGALGSTSSIATAVNSKIIKSMTMLMPTEDVLVKFSSIIGDIFEDIHILSKESSRLSTLRDTLLPKLMSGQIKL